MSEEEREGEIEEIEEEGEGEKGEEGEGEGEIVEEEGEIEGEIEEEEGDIELASYSLKEIDDVFLEKTENVNNLFQMAPNKYIFFKFLYLDKKNNIIHCAKEKVLLQENNIITRAELVDVISRNYIWNTLHYSILSILKYNITISPENLKYIKDYSFLTKIKNIDDILLKNTIEMFKNMNNIIITFYEKEESIRQTKKVYFKKTRSKPSRKQFKEKTLL